MSLERTKSVRLVIMLFSIIVIFYASYCLILPYHSELNKSPENLIKAVDKYKQLKQNGTIIVEVDMSTAKSKTVKGPFVLNRAFSNHLPYDNGKCHFIGADRVTFEHSKQLIDYFFFSFPLFSEEEYNEWVDNKQAHKLYLGPNFVPRGDRKHFPVNDWRENRLPEIVDSIGGLVVQTEPVKNFMLERMDTLAADKIVTVRPCTEVKPKKVKSFQDREIDIIFFEKYYDIDHSKQGEALYKLLSNSGKKVVKLKYGNYNKEQMIEYAENAKFIIYFSFFDMGPGGLKEIQNYGVYIITFQKEFIADENTGIYVPELAFDYNMKLPYDIIMEKIEEVSKQNPDTEWLRKVNQATSDCDRAYDDLCDAIIKNMNRKDNK